MFGLEDQKKKKKTQNFVFDLEKELLDPKRNKEIKKNVENRISELKSILRGGESKEGFDQHGVILQGYTALLKVFTKATQKKKS